MADTLGLTTSQQAKTGHGVVFYIGTGDDLATATWTKVEGMKSGSFPSPDKPEIDVTTTEDSVKAYIPGVGAINDLSIEFNFYPNNSVHRDLVKNVLYTETVRPWKIESADMAFTFFGYMKSANVSFGADAAMTMPLVLKVTSKPTLAFTGVGGTITYDSTLAGNTSTGAVTGSVVGTFAAASGVTASYSTDVTSTFVRNRDFTISNVPAGLTPVLTKTSSTVATLTFTGTATDKTDTNSIVLTFLDSAFTGVTASQVTGATKTLGITFA